MTWVSALAVTQDDLASRLEQYRPELNAYCYRMLASPFEAQDAVQETFIRAWRAFDRFEGRASLRSWMYRIATNVCVDMLRSTERRARPMDLGPAGEPVAEHLTESPEATWVEPVPAGFVVGAEGDPAEIAAARDSVRLAFVAALQHLPPRQRAVLVLREVLRWQASEVAELLETSVASVNSALQRARATLGRLDLEGDAAGAGVVEEVEHDLLERYVDAFERYDMTALVGILRDDAKFSMPPFPLWLEGPDDITRFMTTTGAHCEGSRVLTTEANGGPAVGIYHPTAEGHFEPWAIVVVETAGGGISALHHFLYPELFGQFGLPDRLERA